MSDLVTQRNVDFTQLSAAIDSAETIVDLHEIRARAEAMKAWAKVHRLAKDLRLDLLRIEVDALVRIVELGGADTLSSGDRKAAEWMAAMSPAERDELLAKSGNATTAAGMCRSVWREEEIKQHRFRARAAGIQFAEEPTPPGAWDEAAIRAVRRGYSTVSGALADLLDEYTDEGEPFTVPEMAERILEDSLSRRLDDTDLDPDFEEGVREVCRTAVRKAPPLTVDGTVIPKFITARLSDGEFIRVPTLNALVEHVDDMVRIRTEQLAQDQAALRQLKEFRDRIKAVPGADQYSRVGDLINQSLMDDAALAESA